MHTYIKYNTKMLILMHHSNFLGIWHLWNSSGRWCYMLMKSYNAFEILQCKHNDGGKLKNCINSSIFLIWKWESNEQFMFICGTCRHDRQVHNNYSNKPPITELTSCSYNIIRLFMIFLATYVYPSIGMHDAVPWNTTRKIWILYVHLNIGNTKLKYYKQ